MSKPSALGTLYTQEDEGEEGDFYDDDSSGSDQDASPSVRRPLPQPTAEFQPLIEAINPARYGAIAEDEEEDEGEEPETALLDVPRDQKPKPASFASSKGAQTPGKNAAARSVSLQASIGSAANEAAASSSAAKAASVGRAGALQGAQGKTVNASASKGDAAKEKGMGAAPADETLKKKRRKKKDLIGVNLTLCKYDSGRTLRRTIHHHTYYRVSLSIEFCMVFFSN